MAKSLSIDKKEIVSLLLSDDVLTRREAFTKLLVSNLAFLCIRLSITKLYLITVTNVYSDRKCELAWSLADRLTDNPHWLMISDVGIFTWLVDGTPDNTIEQIQDSYLPFDDYLNLFSEKKWFTFDEKYVNLLVVNKLAEFRRRLEEINKKYITRLYLQNVYVLRTAMLGSMTTAELLVYFLADQFQHNQFQHNQLVYSKSGFYDILDYSFDVYHPTYDKLFCLRANFDEINNHSKKRYEKNVLYIRKKIILYVFADDICAPNTLKVITSINAQFEINESIIFIGICKDDINLINAYANAFMDSRAEDVFMLYKNRAFSMLSDELEDIEKYQVALKPSVDIREVKDRLNAIKVMRQL